MKLARISMALALSFTLVFSIVVLCAMASLVAEAATSGSPVLAIFENNATLTARPAYVQKNNDYTLSHAQSAITSGGLQTTAEIVDTLASFNVIRHSTAAQIGGTAGKDIVLQWPGILKT